MADTSDETDTTPPSPDVDRPGAGEPPSPAAPSDPSLTAVLAEMEADGWSGQLTAIEGGDVRCLTCREVFTPDTEGVPPARRLEGVSDPADMLILVPLRCPHCQAQGVLVANYGPEAPPADADVVAALAD